MASAVVRRPSTAASLRHLTGNAPNCHAVRCLATYRALGRANLRQRRRTSCGKEAEHMAPETARAPGPEAREHDPWTRNPFLRFFRILGPGLVTGAADDDPSGVATYAQAGATYAN